VIEDNTYCHTQSKGGGKFINRNASVIKGWMSEISSNNELCK